jgi:release factor glutamine methyltransferase
MTVAEGLRDGSKLLQENTIAEPEREAVLLMGHAIKRDRTFIYANPEYRLNAVESILFKAVLRRRAAHEPFQYIVGRQEFYGLEFYVTPDVLIPRPETEILVETAIKEFQNYENCKFLEVGVGSGCISVSILANLPNAKALGGDVSYKALVVAGNNAENNGVAKRLDLQLSNVYDSIDDREFDLIVSNPPYVPHADLDSLQREVRDFEPKAALFGGTDGLEIIRRIIKGAPKLLRPNGMLLMEIGFDQSERVGDLLKRHGWKTINMLPDLQGIPRIVVARAG